MTKPSIFTKQWLVIRQVPSSIQNINYGDYIEGKIATMAIGLFDSREQAETFAIANTYGSTLPFKIYPLHTPMGKTKGT